LVDKDLVDLVVRAERKSDRIITIEVVVGSDILNVVSIYTPQIGLAEEIKKQFWEDLDLVIQDVPRSEKLVIGGDFNGHIGAGVGGYDTTHGGFGYGVSNNGGVSILDFAVAYDLLAVNSYFKKKEDHLVTFRSGSIKTQIDYFLMRANKRRLCKDCKAIPSEYLETQHRLLVLDVEFKCAIGRSEVLGILELSGGILPRRML